MIIKYSIIVLFRNEGKNLKKLLPHLVAQEGIKESELIGIDTSSTDESEDVFKKYSKNYFCVATNEFDHGRTRNLAGRIAKGKNLIFIAPDAIPTSKRWLTEITKNVNKDTVAVFGGQVPYRNAKMWVNFFYNEAYPERGRIIDKKSIKSFGFQNLFFSTVNCAVDRRFFLENPFPENTIMSEDQLWAHRILKKGFKIFYDSEAKVFHSHKYTILNNFRRHFASGYSLRNLPGNKASGSWKYLINEIKFHFKKGAIYDLPESMLFEFVRGFGYLLGRKGDWIPSFLRKRMFLIARK